MTVGLALLAYQLAGEDAGAVLGIGLSLRIVAFVLISPLFGAYAHLLPRRQVLVARARRPRAGDTLVTVAYAASGGGSMLAALLLPRVLDRIGERTVMLASGALMGSAWRPG